MPNYNSAQQYIQPQPQPGFVPPIFMPQPGQYNQNPQARLKQMEEQNYYNQQYQPPQNIPANPIIWVNGIEGAKAYIIPPNCTVILMDSEDSKFYMKRSDASGMCNVTAFKFEEIVAPVAAPASIDSSQFVTKEAFDKLKSDFDNAMAMVTSFVTASASESPKAENSRRSAVTAALDKKGENQNG